MDDHLSFTFLSDSLSDGQCIDPVLVRLLPGENFIKFSLLNYGCRFGITNYRLIILFDNIKINCETKSSKVISIPIGLIYHIECHGLVCLHIFTKVTTRFKITFPDIESCEEAIEIICNLRKRPPFSLEYYRCLNSELPKHFILNGKIKNDDWSQEYDIFESEFKRLKFPQTEWRISKINSEWKTCASYPSFNIVLLDFTDAQLKNMAAFRSKNRFISASYRLRSTGTVLLRSGQPKTGVSNSRNYTDEEYLQKVINLTSGKEINGCNASPKSNSGKVGDVPIMFKIFDARSYTVAQMNRVHGGGMESEWYYNNCSVEFMNIPNMHSVRSSFDNLVKCLEQDSENFYEDLDRTGWLQLIKKLLESAYSICHTMLKDKMSVLVHCSDGWDRTPQLVSLAQLLMDSHYRTMHGFIQLIQKEWIYFGHKFNDRNALWPKEISREYSPIFLQWLDCVFQIYHQFPDCFQFNELFLIKIALHVSSGLFGTFNKDMYRMKGVDNEPPHTSNLWNLLSHSKHQCYLNPLYSSQTTVDKVLQPRTQLAYIKLWMALYKDGLNPYLGELDSKLLVSNLDVTSVSQPVTDMEVENTENGMITEKMLRQNCKNKLNLIYENKAANIEEEDENYIVDNCFNSDLTLNLFLENEQSNQNLSLNNSFRTSHLFDKKNSSYFSLWLLTDIHKEYTNKLSEIDCDDIGLDGLHHNKDLINIYSNYHRARNRLLQKKVEFFRKICRDLFQRLLKNNEKNAIEAALDNLEDLSRTTTLSESSLDDTNDVEDDGTVLIQELVPWVPDDSVSVCFGCQSSFYFLKRKHHCRSCGRIFCSSCSSKKCPVPKEYISWPERVCNDCFIQLCPTEVGGVKETNFTKKLESFKRLIGIPIIH